MIASLVLFYSTNLLERLTNEQADFWQRWRTLSGCSDDALTEKALPDVAWLAERITTTADLASLYQSNSVMLLALCEKRGTTFSPPHLKNLIKHYSTWKTAQSIKQKRAERTNQKTVSGTGTIQNWTLARLSGKLDAPPVVYPDVEKPTKPMSATESMGIKRELAAMLEGLQC